MRDFEPQGLRDLVQGYCDDELHVLLPELLVHGCQNFEALLKPDIQVSQSTGCPLRAAWHQTVIHKQEGPEQGRGVDGQMVQRYAVAGVGRVLALDHPVSASS